MCESTQGQLEIILLLCKVVGYVVCIVLMRLFILSSIMCV